MRKMIYIGFIVALAFIIAISYPGRTHSVEVKPVEVWIQMTQGSSTTFSLIKFGAAHWDENL